MKSLLKSLFRWLDERLDIAEYVRRDILDKPIPKGLNLSYCFGGITFFLFVMLAITGYFMTFYYIPSPDHAYDSVDYMTFQVQLGYIIRGVHHWSSNLIMVTIFIHMVRVYVYGAYKKPREINWITGVFLIVLIMTFGFSGYLLPWDQKAYWATRVGTTMIDTVPFIGPYLMKLSRGGEEVGALTLARFYSIHVLFLPLFTTFFLAGHFLMIRRQGISKPL